MARYTDATESWQNVTLTKDEVWYCHSGLLILDTNSSPGANDGVPRYPGQSIGPLPTGMTVYYRAGNDMDTIYERIEVSQ